MTIHTMDMPYRQGCAGQVGPGNHGKKTNEFREDGFKIDSSCLIVLETCFEQRQTYLSRELETATTKSQAKFSHIYVELRAEG